MKQPKIEGVTPFQFAGFNWPRYVVNLTPVKKLKAKHKNPVTGGYYHAPKPLSRGPHPGHSFYLGSDFTPSPRWMWCDDVDISISHTGWFCDEYQGQKIRGIVVYLPHGRMLAGWSMGEGMASYVDGDIYTYEVDAARTADSMAEDAAEREREYQAEWEAEREREEAAEELARKGQVPNVYGLWSIYEDGEFNAYDCPMAALEAFNASH